MYSFSTKEILLWHQQKENVFDTYQQGDASVFQDIRGPSGRMLYCNNGIASDSTCRKYVFRIGIERQTAKHHTHSGFYRSRDVLSF